MITLTWNDGYQDAAHGRPCRTANTDLTSDYRRGYDDGVQCTQLEDFAGSDDQLAAGIAGRRARLRNKRNNRHLKGATR